MNKIKIIIPLLLFFLCGCANQQLDNLKEIEKQNTIGLIQAYDNALEKTKVERLDLENQIIDLQSNYDLVVLAFEVETGSSFSDVAQSRFISFADLSKHYENVDKAKKEQEQEILKSYSSFYEIINAAKNPKLMKAIEKIEEERKKTRSSFFGSILDVFKNLISGSAENVQ